MSRWIIFFALIFAPSVHASSLAKVETTLDLSVEILKRTSLDSKKLTEVKKTLQDVSAEFDSLSERLDTMPINAERDKVIAEKHAVDEIRLILLGLSELTLDNGKLTEESCAIADGIVHAGTYFPHTTVDAPRRVKALYRALTKSCSE